jgi:hypothetical protein
MSSFAIAGAAADQSPARNTLQSKTVEIYEVQVRSSLLSEWREARVPWTDKAGMASRPRDELTHDAGHIWQGNWKLDVEEGVGSRDEEGWEYATAASRFGQGQGAHRVPRAKGLKDFGRRRKWVRLMKPKGSGASSGTMEQKLATIASLLRRLNKAQKEIQKMGSLLGTADDSASFRETITDYLGKVRMAQNEVRRQIETLGERQMTARGLRELEKITGPFDATEETIRRKLREDPPDKESVAEGRSGLATPGATEGARVRQSSVSGGKGAFRGNADEYEEGGTLSAASGKGAYVSRQRQEQLMESKLRVVDSDIVDRQIMEEREQHINKILAGQHELNTLFSEMAEHVGNQQESINQIEGNVDNAALKVQEGIDHLEKAAEHQRSCTLS